MAEKITAKEVKFAINCCATAAERAKASAAADEAKSSAMMGVFERLLGVKTAAELAVLSPDEIGKMAKRRLKKGDIELEGFTLEELLKVIQQSACRRNVAWKDAFVKVLGESAAKELQAATQETYSYKFVQNDLGKISAEEHAAAIGGVPA